MGGDGWILPYFEHRIKTHSDTGGDMTPDDSLQALIAALDQRYAIAKTRTQRTEAELAAKRLQLQAVKDEVAEWTHLLACLKAHGAAVLRAQDEAGHTEAPDE